MRHFVRYRLCRRVDYAVVRCEGEVSAVAAAYHGLYKILSAALYNHFFIGKRSCSRFVGEVTYANRKRSVGYKLSCPFGKLALVEYGAVFAVQIQHVGGKPERSYIPAVFCYLLRAVQGYVGRKLVFRYACFKQYLGRRCRCGRFPLIVCINYFNSRNIRT